ncbi:hypothetical protein MNBD_GAMMA12-2962 [hydrothermal vent metagenome]|uniref:DUF4878 domain-containing protein n=1 Tax=hydrothermal vent metagenome TaxID=652676 RepID=A0A3B0YSU2_9ZZZZ
MQASIKSKFSTRLMMTIFLCAIMSSQLYAQDQKDPRWTATQILTHYKAKNWKVLLVYTTGSNTKYFNSIISGKNSSRLSSITSGWRWNVVSAWDGKIGELREGVQGLVYAKFAQKDKDCYLVAMLKKDQQWYLEDIKSPKCETFKNYKAR